MGAEGAPRAPARTGRFLARSRGLLALATIAGAGVLLWRPGGAPEPAPGQVEVTAYSPSAWILLAGGAPREAAPAGTLIVLRVPAILDARRSVLSFDDGRERVVPRGARSVLVHPDGRVEAFRAPLLSDTLFRFLRSQPSAGRAGRLREWVSGTKPFPHGAGVDERLRRFLQDS